jgi:hypothetical protein
VTVRWSGLEESAPTIASRGRELFFQYGVGLGYLATIRGDGGPRIHPFCPIVAYGGLWGFIAPSPKQRDLRRDGRCAVHSFPAEDVDDELYLQCRAVAVHEPQVIDEVRAAYHAPIQGDDETLFELLIERAMLATYVTRPSWPPRYTIWIAP